MKTFASRLLLLLGLVCFAADARSQALTEAGDPAEAATTTALATRFVKLVDQGKSAETWASTGPILHTMTNPVEWAATLKAMRAAPLKKRALFAARFTKVIDGAPNGHYFVIFFASTFGKQKYEEKVIYSKVKGKWKVEGYFLTPISDDAAPTRAPLPQGLAGQPRPGPGARTRPAEACRQRAAGWHRHQRARSTCSSPAPTRRPPSARLQAGAAGTGTAGQGPVAWRRGRRPLHRDLALNYGRKFT